MPDFTSIRNNAIPLNLDDEQLVLGDKAQFPEKMNSMMGEFTATTVGLNESFSDINTLIDEFNNSDLVQARLAGRLTYQTKAGMDAAGAPPSVGTDGQELAEVWGDGVNSGIYGWNGSAWVIVDHWSRNEVFNVFMVPGLANQGVPDLDRAAKTLTIHTDTILRSGTDTKLLTSNIVIDLDIGSTAIQVYYSFSDDTFLAKAWNVALTSAEVESKYHLFAFIRLISGGQGTFLSMMGPYTIDKIPYGIEHPKDSTVYIIPGFGSPGLPNLDTSNKTLTFYNSTTFRTSTKIAFVTTDTVVDLSGIASTAIQVYMNLSTMTFIARSYATNLTAAEHAYGYVLIAFVRLISGGEAGTYMAMTGNYTVNKAPIDYDGVASILLGQDAEMPDFSTADNTFTIPAGAYIIGPRKTAKNIVATRVFSFTLLGTLTATKLYYNFETDTFIQKEWFLEPSDGSYLLAHLQLSTPVISSKPAVSCSFPYTIDGNPLGRIELSGGSMDIATQGVAHRGASSIAPENTIPAYTLAKRKGFIAVECDVRWTSDNVPVLLHDATVDRTSDGGLQNIVSLTLAEVKAMDFGSWKSAEYAGTEIPTFLEFMILCKRLGLYPFIELKTAITSAQANILRGIVYRTGMTGANRHCWLSDSTFAISEISSSILTAKVSVLTNNVVILNAVQTATNTVFSMMSVAEFDSGGAGLAVLDAGYESAVYECETEADAIRLSGLGVSYLVTDTLNVPRIVQKVANVL